MIGRPRAHTSIGDDIDPGSLMVFIPGALASGFLVSLGLLAGDALRSLRGDAGKKRKVELAGAAIAEEVLAGAGAARTLRYGLRAPWFYGGAGVASLALALMVIPGATWNFLNPVGYIDHIGWIWMLSLLGAVAFALLGLQLMSLAQEWVPLLFVVVGAGTVLRFLLGSEPGSVRIAAIVVGAAVGLLGAGSTWRLRKRRGVTDIRPGVRPVLRATPLARLD